MAGSFSVTITFTDGTSEHLSYVTHLTNQDGVLHAYVDNGYVREHKGSWPLVNIKSYLRGD